MLCTWIDLTIRYFMCSEAVTWRKTQHVRRRPRIIYSHCRHVHTLNRLWFL